MHYAVSNFLIHSFIPFPEVYVYCTIKV
uniref:Uncharacterized protein n=1 Tax=Anguilla anguilla TaxID=7936 RepID=A0A0E9PL81_ANGAN